MVMEIRQDSLRDLQRTLQQIPVNVEKNILRGMIRAAAKPVAAEARALAPELAEADPRREKGALKRAVRIMSTAFKRGSVRGGVVVGSARKLLGSIRDAFYAKWVEYGRAGMAAQPFLRPAADNKGGEAVDAAWAYVRERIAAGDLKR